MNNNTDQIYLLNPAGRQSSCLLQRIAENSSANQVNLENVEDFSKVCRTCATITDQVVPVFSGEGLQNNLAEKINKHLPIEMCVSDELPVCVCVQCAHTVLAWHELAQCCAQADTALRTRLHHLKATRVPTPPDRKSARDAAGQFEGNNQQNELEAASPPAPPPQYPRTKPPLQRCKYCPAQETPDTYRAHLEAEHLELLFQCDECNSLVDRKDFIIHMSLHILQNTVLEENQERVERQERVEKRERMQREENAETARNQTSSSNNKKPETPANNTSAPTKVETRRNSIRKRRIKNENQESNAQRVAKTERSTRNVKREVLSVPERATPEPTTATANKALDPRMKTEVASNDPNTNNNENLFSDHSDTEEFGELPQSVFQAIEDTQDGQAFNTENTNDKDPQQEVTSDSESENESPEDKAKKNSKRTRVCPICSKVYTASSSYFYHIKYSHKGVREHECQECGRKFITRNCLTQHMSTHSQKCDFECRVCGKKFRTNASLYIHEQSHSGVKLFNCDRCDLSFRWKTHFVRHVKRHTAEKAHVCETCGRGFTIHCDLLRHKRTHEAGSYKCARCGLKFAQVRYLKVHMNRKHINPIIVK